VWRTGGSGVTTVQKDLAETCYLHASLSNIRTRYDSNKPKFFGIRLLILAYDAHGTLTTDNIADFEAVSRLYFKDP